MFSRIRNYFITGVALTLPVAITIIIVRFLVIKLNSYVLQPLVEFLRLNPYLTKYSLVIAKVLVFILVIYLISLVGWAANIIFLRKIFGLGEKMFVKVPMVGKIYSITKEIGSAFLGQGKFIFKRVALIEYPRKGVYSLAFETGKGRKEMNDLTGKNLITLFLPTTPNPTSGIFLLAPPEEITFLELTVEEGLKLVVSSGAIASEIDRKSRFG